MFATVINSKIQSLTSEQPVPSMLRFGETAVAIGRDDYCKLILDSRVRRNARIVNGEVILPTKDGEAVDIPSSTLVPVKIVAKSRSDATTVVISARYNPQTNTCLVTTSGTTSAVYVTTKDAPNIVVLMLTSGHVLATSDAIALFADLKSGQKICIVEQPARTVCIAEDRIVTHPEGEDSRSSDTYIDKCIRVFQPDTIEDIVNGIDAIHRIHSPGQFALIHTPDVSNTEMDNMRSDIVNGSEYIGHIGVVDAAFPIIFKGQLIDPAVQSAKVSQSLFVTI